MPPPMVIRATAPGNGFGHSAARTAPGLSRTGSSAIPRVLGHARVPGTPRPRAVGRLARYQPESAITTVVSRSPRRAPRQVCLAVSGGAGSARVPEPHSQCPEWSARPRSGRRRSGPSPTLSADRSNPVSKRCWIRPGLTGEATSTQVAPPSLGRALRGNVGPFGSRVTIADLLLGAYPLWE